MGEFVINLYNLYLITWLTNNIFCGLVGIENIVFKLLGLNMS